MCLEMYLAIEGSSYFEFWIFGFIETNKQLVITIFLEYNLLP